MTNAKQARLMTWRSKILRSQRRLLSSVTLVQVASRPFYSHRLRRLQRTHAVALRNRSSTPCQSQPGHAGSGVCSNRPACT